MLLHALAEPGLGEGGMPPKTTHLPAAQRLSGRQPAHPAARRDAGRVECTSGGRVAFEEEKLSVANPGSGGTAPRRMQSRVSRQSCRVQNRAGKQSRVVN
jgi:hypothetical protein